MRAIAIVLLALAVAIPATACGVGGGQAGPEDAVKDFVRALEREKVSKIYDYLSEECQQEVSLEEFMANWGFFALYLSEIGELKAKNVEVLAGNDRTATVTFDLVLRTRGEEVPLMGGWWSGKDPNGGVNLVKENGDWRFANCNDFSLFGD